MNHLVFISHSSRDDDLALRICDRLEAMGVRCWLDRKDLDGNALEGVDYARAIVRAIDHSSIFVSILTDTAELSENVKNETELAHRKRAQGMVILPLRLSQEDLAEEFRYYFCRTNMFDGTLPPLEERIRAFCEVVKSAVDNLIGFEHTPAADQARLKLLDTGASLEERAIVDNFIARTSPVRISRVLAHCAKDLDAHYRDIVDPYEHYRFYNTYETGGCRLRVLVDTLYARGIFSIALGDVYENVSYVLINSGKIAYVQDARRFLDCALSVYEHMMDKSPDSAERLTESIILCQWLLSITHKIERNYGMSEQILLGLLRYAEEQREELGLPYAKSVLLPKRELAIINEDREAFISLVNEMGLIEDSKELFYTYRRAFEFFCSEDDEEWADALRGPMIDAFNACRDELYGVYYYAMMYNVYLFYARFGRVEEAVKLYDELMPELENNHFERYATHLKAAHKRLLAGRKVAGYVR